MTRHQLCLRVRYTVALARHADQKFILASTLNSCKSDARSPFRVRIARVLIQAYNAQVPIVYRNPTVTWCALLMDYPMVYQGSNLLD